MKSNSEILNDSLVALFEYGGSIILEIGDYYIQFASDNKVEQFTFEAVSHIFLDILPENLNKDFKNLGFKIEDGNYFKQILSTDIATIQNDTKIIFENIYKVNYNKTFKIKDDINYDNLNSELNSTKTNFKFSPKQVLIAIIVIIGSYYFLNSNTSNPAPPDLKVEAYAISQDFVTNKLLSPSSVIFPDMDKAQIEYLGSGRYSIRSYLDASNAFGAIIRNRYFVTVKYTGHKDNKTNWVLESIEIE